MQSEVGASTVRSWKETWKELWPFLAGGLGVLILWAVMAFFAEVVFASTDPVRAYASKEACCQDLAVKAGGGYGAASLESYSDDIAFHVRSHLSHYSLGGQYYAASTSLRRL